MSEPYPRDEFDAVLVPRDGRRGAHRSRPTLLASLAPQVAAALIVIAAGAGVVTMVSQPSSDAQAAATPAGGVSAAAVVGTTAPSTPAPAASSEPAPSAVSPSAVSPSTVGHATSSPTASTAAVATKAPVVILNSTSTSGLAARSAATLTRAGWHVASTGNAPSPVAATVVQYSDPTLAATATAIARQVGGTAVREPEAAAGTITVVLGPDAAG